jgi:hypothetical protein
MSEGVDDEATKGEGGGGGGGGGGGEQDDEERAAGSLSRTRKRVSGSKPFVTAPSTSFALCSALLRRSSPWSKKDKAAWTRRTPKVA